MELSSLASLRHRLHALAEPSGEEEDTAALVTAELSATNPDELFSGLGGHGVAAVYHGAAPGPTVALRADLDGLPIPETLDIPHGSLREGVAHKCGHDGHMTMALGVARTLGSQRPPAGRVVVLFQPSEEDGRGARRIAHTSLWKRLAPARVVALHNLPGVELGAVVIRRGIFASASRGMIIRLGGRTSHAAEPHRGQSPAAALACLIHELPRLPGEVLPFHEAALVTVIHARLGEVAFGTTPGAAVVMATFRSHREEAMEALVSRSESLARAIGGAQGLEVEVEWTEEFPPVINHDQTVDRVEEAARTMGLTVETREIPFPWSEDVGHLVNPTRGVLFGLGSGRETPALHSPVYDFPDSLLDVGVSLLHEVVSLLLLDRRDK